LKEIVIKNREFKFKFLAGLVISVFLILIIRLWILQIMEGATIMIKSKENQTRVIRVNAPRGLFYDRKGKILVSSRLSHNVSVVPEDIKDKPEILSLLSKILKTPEAAIEEKLKPDPKHPRNPYQFIPIANDLDPTTVIKLLEAKLDLPGVEVDEAPVRSYLYGEFASHLFGYIREINDSELSQFKEKGYRLGDLIGKTGLERTYEEYLRGSDGGKIFEVDIHGRPLCLLENREPTPGNNIHLTIDQKIQTVAEQAFSDQLLYLQKYTKYRNAKAGAVVVLDPRDGDILAMVSKPGFDPNLFVGMIPPEVAEKLYNNPLHPFTNRAVQGEFAPGSTFKPITVAAALMEHKVDLKQQFYCNGYDPIWGKKFKCWVVGSEQGRHGAEDIVAGLKNSCNIVMAELSRRVGPDILAKYARFFGLGKPTGLQLNPGEVSGLVADPDWKRKNTKEKEWYPLETMHFGIGQGYLTVTPLQLAQVYAAIANNGKVYRPRIVSKITTPTGQVVKQFNPQLSMDLKLPKEVSDIIHQGLLAVVSEGTAAWVFQGFPLDKYPVAGKTGTAQKPPYDDYGIFASYAPANKPEIVIIILIEQAGSGSGGAAPVARKILEAYFNLDQKPAGAPNPTKPAPTIQPVPGEGENQATKPVGTAETEPGIPPANQESGPVESNPPSE
jgi:penicillin-binding protein 2